jgi:hypothetical protein
MESTCGVVKTKTGNDQNISSNCTRNTTIKKIGGALDKRQEM